MFKLVIQLEVKQPSFSFMVRAGVIVVASSCSSHLFDFAVDSFAEPFIMMP